jgi:hypothetical protein
MPDKVCPSVTRPVSKALELTLPPGGELRVEVIGFKPTAVGMMKTYKLSNRLQIFVDDVLVGDLGGRSPVDAYWKYPPDPKAKHVVKLRKYYEADPGRGDTGRTSSFENMLVTEYPRCGGGSTSRYKIAGKPGLTGDVSAVVYETAPAQ